MTREEAIRVLGLRVADSEEKYQATCMAIKALEQESVLDKIRAEIEFIPTIEWKDDGTTYILASYFKKQVLEIIDKYKTESEDKE